MDLLSWKFPPRPRSMLEIPTQSMANVTGKNMVTLNCGEGEGCLLGLVSCSPECVASAGAGVLLMGQQGFPLGLCNWLHLCPVCFVPVCVVVYAESADVNMVSLRSPQLLSTSIMLGVSVGIFSLKVSSNSCILCGSLVPQILIRGDIWFWSGVSSWLSASLCCI